jgi:prepilin-type N-terminal cleavage/methylation domain-containing protein
MSISQITNRKPQSIAHGFAPLESSLRLGGRHNQKKRQQRTSLFLMGFTLVEVMFVVAIFSVMFVVAFDVLLSGRRSFDVSSIRYDIQTNAALGLNNMMRELKNSASSQIDISADGDFVEFSVPIGYDGNGDIIWGADAIADNQIRYEVSGAQLLRDRLNSSGVLIANTTRILANYVESVFFTGRTNGLTMNITTSEQNKVTREWLSESLSSTLTFRN